MKARNDRKFLKSGLVLFSVLIALSCLKEGMAKHLLLVFLLFFGPFIALRLSKIDAISRVKLRYFILLVLVSTALFVANVVSIAKNYP